MKKDQVKELGTKLGLSPIQRSSRVTCVCSMYIRAHTCAYYTVKRRENREYKQKSVFPACTYVHIRVHTIQSREEKTENTSKRVYFQHTGINRKDFKIIMVVVFKNRKRQTK